MLNKKYSLLLLFLSIIGQTSAMEQDIQLLDSLIQSVLRYIVSRSHLQDKTLPIEQLCTAAHNDDTKKIEALLKQGVNPNAESFVSLRPLHYAAMKGNIDACTLLVQYGANPSVSACEELFYETPLHTALAATIPINEKNNAVATYLIKECRVNPNTKNESQHVYLHQVALAGNREIFKLLLQNGAHPHATNVYGSNALHSAACPWEGKSEKTIIECVRELLFLGTDHKKQNQQNKTPAQCAQTGLVQKILENDESVKKFMISHTTLHGKNIYKELMNRQVNHYKQPMHLTKLNLEQTKTLFLGNGQAK